MRRRFWIVTLIILITVTSCNFPGAPPPATPAATPTVERSTQTVISPTPTAIDTSLTEIVLPTATATSTPSITLASPREQPVNCRFGPDIAYAVIGALNPGQYAEVIGKNIDITWLYVRNPSDPSTTCWLSVDFVVVEGDVLLLPVVGPPEIRVTSIEVRVEPVAMNVACDAFPQSVILSADITTNGPSVVIWQWESNTGQTSSPKELLFESGLTKTVQDYIQVNRAADYTVQVKTLLPNMMAGDTTFKVICTP